MDWPALLAHAHWHLYLWVATGLAFLFTEIYAAIRGRHYATFTYIVKRGLPRWLVAAILAGLAWHFLVQP